MSELVEQGEIVTYTPKLRFVPRNGRRILQQLIKTELDGHIYHDWQDIPTHSEEE